jgi:hypothetical protein
MFGVNVENHENGDISVRNLNPEPPEYQTSILLNSRSHIFQKCGKYLQILDTTRVTMKQVPYWEFINNGRNCTKYIRVDEQAAQICAHLT